MADVFDREPIAFVDQNDQFPVLNEDVGFTYQQLKRLVENTNYLYNNLGLASIEIDSVETQFPSPGTFADVVIDHNVAYIDGKPLDRLGFLFKIPTPRITATLNTTLIDETDTPGMTLQTTPIKQTVGGKQVTTGYAYEFFAKIPSTPTHYIVYDRAQTLTNEEKLRVRRNIGAGTSDFDGDYNNLSNKPNLSTVATSGDYDDLLNKPKAVLYVSQSLSNTQKATARNNIGAGTSNFDGAYASLSGKPTKLSDFENDEGFVKSVDVTYVSYTGVQYLTTAQKQRARENIGAGTSSFSGNYDDLTNTPTSLSEFTNDIGYITSSALSNYYTKNQTYSKTQVDELLDDISIDLSNYYTKSETNTAITNALNNYTPDLSNYYTKSQTNTEIVNALNNYTPDLSNYYTISQTNNAISTALNNYTPDLSNYYTISQTNDAISTALSHYTPDLSNYYTKTEIDSAGYLVQSDLNGYALYSDLPTSTSDLINDSGYITTSVSNLTHYYTKTEIDNAGFLTSSDLSGYALLTDIPVNVSDLTNDVGFITSTVNNLTYYYTKTEVDSMIGGSGFSVVIVSTLPASGNSNTLYLVPSTDPQTSNLFDEYMYITKQDQSQVWELIGSASIDLSNYYTKAQIDNILPNYENVIESISVNNQALTPVNKGVNIDLSGYALSSSLATVATTGSYNDLSNKPAIPVVDNALDTTSSNAIQNAPVASAINTLNTSVTTANTNANTALSTANSASSTANSVSNELYSLTMTSSGRTITFATAHHTVGSYTLPPDQYLSNVSLNSSTNALTFTWAEQNVNATSQDGLSKTIDLSRYSYTNGAGLNLLNGEFSIALANNSKLTLNNDLLDVDLSSYYTKSDLTNKVVPQGSYSTLGDNTWVVQPASDYSGRIELTAGHNSKYMIAINTKASTRASGFRGLAISGYDFKDDGANLIYYNTSNNVNWKFDDVTAQLTGEQIITALTTANALNIGKIYLCSADSTTNTNYKAGRLYLIGGSSGAYTTTEVNSGGGSAINLIAGTGISVASSGDDKTISTNFTAGNGIKITSSNSVQQFAVGWSHWSVTENNNGDLVFDYTS